MKRSLNVLRRRLTRPRVCASDRLEELDEVSFGVYQCRDTKTIVLRRLLDKFHASRAEPLILRIQVVGVKADHFVCACMTTLLQRGLQVPVLVTLAWVFFVIIMTERDGGM